MGILAMIEMAAAGAASLERLIGALTDDATTPEAPGQAPRFTAEDVAAAVARGRAAAAVANATGTAILDRLNREGK